MMVPNSNSFATRLSRLTGRGGTTMKSPRIAEMTGMHNTWKILPLSRGRGSHPEGYTGMSIIVEARISFISTVSAPEKEERL